jgi:hypothetical protein
MAQKVQIKVVVIKATGDMNIEEVLVEKGQYEEIQELVGGHFEMKTIYSNKNVDYAIYMNENGKYLNLPLNKNFQNFLPGFPFDVVGNVVIGAFNNKSGNDINFNILIKNLQKKANKWCTERYGTKDEQEKRWEAIFAELNK